MESETLSIILPTSNRQDQIVERVETLIDHVSDLCDQLQIVVVDDGSTDATPEILQDLERVYPQVSSVRNRNRLGPKKAVDIGLAQAIGTFVFIQESYDQIDTQAMRQLWNLRNDQNLVVARVGTRTRRIDNALLDQLSKWGKRIEENWGVAAAAEDEKGDVNTSMVPTGLQMIRRDSLSKLARVDEKESAFEVSHLTQRKLVRANRSLPSNR